MWETRSVFHISMPRFLPQEGWRRWWSVAQRRMRPYRVVVHSPLFDHHLGLLQRIEDLALQAFISQLAVEALTVPVLPGDVTGEFCTRGNVRETGTKGAGHGTEETRRGADRCHPASDRSRISQPQKPPSSLQRSRDHAAD